MIITFYPEGGDGAVSSSFVAECSNVCITDDLDGAKKALSFSISDRLPVSPETIAVCKGTRFVVKEVRVASGLDSVEVSCIIDLSEFDGVWVDSFFFFFFPYNGHEGIDYGESYDERADYSTPAYCAQDVVSALYHSGLVPPGWTFRYLVNPLAPDEEPITGRELLLLNGVFEVEKVTLTDALAKLAGMIRRFGGAYSVDNERKIVSLGAVGFGEKPYGHAVPFVLGHNLRSYTRTEDSRGIVTRLYAYGKDGLGLSLCPYVEDFSFSRRVLVGVWTNTDIQNEYTLREAALERLSVLCRPTVSYGVDIIDLANIRTDAATLAYSVGMYARVEDDRMRIVRTISYPDEPERNSIELSSPIPTLEDLAASWSKIINADGTVNGVLVRGVRAGDVVGIETVITENGVVRSAVESVVRDVIGG